MLPNSLCIRAGLVALLSLAATSPSAQTASSLRIGAPPHTCICVIVDIAGHRAGQLDCATRALQEAARTAQGQARTGFKTPVTDARSADIRTGVASQSATRQRLGNAFGVSVRPQRPAPVPLPPRGGSMP